MVAPAWVIGWPIRERRALATRQSEQLVRQAATEERLRVARELHDVVAHTHEPHRGEGGRRQPRRRGRPAEAGDALRVIEETGRTALTDVRRVLGVLREDSPYAPTPGLDELPRLARQAAIGGVDVQLDVRRDEPAGAVPESVGLAVYRIVQEAVTNVVKHAGAGRLPGHGDRPARRGAGGGDRRRPAAGPARRAGARADRHAGTGGVARRGVPAGPRSDGGFAVTASLPYRVAA